MPKAPWREAALYTVKAHAAGGGRAPCVRLLYIPATGCSEGEKEEMGR